MQSNNMYNVLKFATKPRFKQQRKEIESSLMEKPQAGGGG